MRLDMTREAARCTGAHDCHAEVHREGCFYSDVESPEHPQYEPSEAARPQCTVHPEGPVIDMGYMSLPKEFHDEVETAAAEPKPWEQLPLFDIPQKEES